MPMKNYEIIIDFNYWLLNSKCNCPFFKKNFKCKHIMGVAKRLGMPDTRFPEAAADIPVGQKRKKGAPRKNSRALING